MSFFAIASTTDVGTMCSRMSHPPCCECAIVESEAVSAPAGSATPAPGRITFTITSPITRAMVVASSNHTIAFRPMRPTAFRSPVPAMPMTRVEKMSGARIILISRRNRSASGRMATPVSGQTWPITMPMARPMKIWVVRPGRRLREAAPGVDSADMG